MRSAQTHDALSPRTSSTPPRATKGPQPRCCRGASPQPTQQARATRAPISGSRQLSNRPQTHGRHSMIYQSTKRRNIDMDIDMIAEIKAAMAELEYSGIIERTGEMRWAERSREWQPVYALTE